MSGLDGLGWPNPEDEPKPKKTMNSQLEIKLAPTPETDAENQRIMESWNTYASDHCKMLELAQKLERERDEAQERADTMFAKHVDILDQTRNERDEARGQLAGIENKMRGELGGHPDSELWGDAGLIAATMRCVDALDAVTEQRNRLAAAVNAATVLIAAKGRHNTLLAYEGLRSALSPENADVDLPDTAAQDSSSKSNNPAVSG